MVRLQDLEMVLLNPLWSEEGFENVSWLVSAPVDITFEAVLENIPAHVLAYALALVSGREGHGIRAGKIRARLNKIMQTVELEEIGV